MSWRKTFFLTAFVVLAGLAAAPAFATDYYVAQNDPAADDSNPGTEALPWETLKKACNTLVAGDTVYVKAGTYIDPINSFRVVNNGTAGNPITFISSPQLAAVVRSPSLPGSRSAYAWSLGPNSQHVIVDGFKIEGGIVAAYDRATYCTLRNLELIYGWCAGDPSLNWGITLYWADYCVVENCYVHDITSSDYTGRNAAGIMLFGDPDHSDGKDACEYNIFQGNTVDVGFNVRNAYGIKAGYLNNNTWRYNVALNASVGYHTMGSTSGEYNSSYNHYYQNIAINCGAGFDAGYAVDHSYIYNNTAVDCDSFYTSYYDSVTDIELWNNILEGDNDIVIEWPGYPGPYPFTHLIAFSNYNCFYDFSEFAYREKSPSIHYYTLGDWQSATGYDMDTITSNPLLVGGGDYHLQGSSPCINAGVDLQDYDDDDNTTESIDMGAYITGSEIIGHNWGPTPPGQASNPSPGDSATDVSIDADLSWTAGSGSTSSDVYFGTSSPGTFQGNQTMTSFEPGTMSYSTTYYWRIDEVNAQGTTTGSVWSFTTETAPAAVYYVDQGNPAADDENPGTEALPWETLLKACQTVVAGDTVYVKAGVYIDTVNTFERKFKPTNYGTAANPITFISTPQHAAVVRSASLPSSRSDFAWGLSWGSQYIIIDGFKIEGGLVLGYDGCDHCTVRNCELVYGRCPDSDPSLNWGLATHGASYCTIENNYVHDMNDSGNNAHNTACFMVFGDSDYNILQGNTANASNGIIYSAFGQKGGSMDHNIWRYNLALNATAGFLGMASTDETRPTEDNTYYQNIAVNCDNFIVLDHMAYRFVIYNNTAVDCDKFLGASKNTNIDTEMWNNILVGTNFRAIWWSGYPDAMPFSTLIDYSNYNCFYNNAMIAFREKSPSLYYYTLNDWQTGTGFGIDSIVDNPLLVGGGDYHLQGGSPCINAGVDLQDYDDDENTTESINMGAYITGSEVIGHNWGPTAPSQAASPSPADSATDVSITADLSWTAGSGTTSHDVYFGTDSTPDSGEFQGNQTAASYDPGAMANDTTYYWRIDEVNAQGTTTGNVWSFTTETASGPDAFLQDSGTDGIVSMEAENYDVYTQQGAHDWISVTTPTGYTGSAAMNTTPNNGTNQNTGYAANSPRLDFQVDFVKTGTHYVWIRGYGATGSDDSIHAGLDGAEISTCDRISTFTTSYTWSKATMDGVDATFNVASTGVHTVNAWMREDGFVFDKIVLTTNVNYTPTGDGPAESPRGAQPPGQASNPSPANSAADVGIDTDLSWTAGTDATSHDVYFGTSSPGAFQGNQTATTFDPATLSYDVTYYWRIDEINTAGTTTGAVWSFTTEAAPTPPGQATNPDPADSATDVNIIADLSWTAGTNSTSSDVYFGTSSPGTFQGNQTATTFEPGTLDYDTTYYWRIDEINAGGTTTGNVWNFTTAAAPVNECDNWQTLHPEWIFCDDFETEQDLTVSFDDTDGGSSGMSVTTNDPYDGLYSLEQHYTIGQVDAGWVTKFIGDNPHLASPGDKLDEVYYRWYHKFENGFSGLPQKMARTKIFRTSDDWSGGLAFYNWIHTSSSLLDVEIRTYDGVDYIWLPAHFTTLDYSNAANIGIWICIEVRLETNTIGQSDGEIQYWVDGVEDLYATGLDLQAENNNGKGLNMIMWGCYWNDGSPADQSRFYDNLVISTAPIGQWTPGQNPPGQASNPSPADSATDVAVDADLSWTAGTDSTSSDVYFGTTSPGTFQGNQTATTFDPGTLANDTTYYWRIDEINAEGTTTGNIWSFTTIVAVPGQASSPSPADSAADIAVDADLSWTAGSGAASHDVYFGTSSPGAFQGNQAATTFDTGSMANDTTYYWRIDEVNVGGTTTGTVWSFTTIVGMPAQASSPSPGTGASDIAVDTDLSWTAGSGAASHDVYFGTSSPGSYQGNQAATTFDTGSMSNDTTYYWRIDEVNAAGTTTGTVWNFTTIVAAPGQASSPSPGNGATDVAVNADLSWTAGSGAASHDVYFGTSSPGSYQGNQADTTFDTGSMSNDTTYYWRIDEINAGGTTTGTVWSFTTIVAAPDQASNPSPANVATDVDINTNLSWTAGSGATSHDVYFGTSSPGSYQGNQADTTFNPGTMAYNTTYYWRIDEVNAGGTTTGAVWSFTTESAPLPPPGQANNPNPADSAVDVGVNTDLSWTAGSNATSHDVYFGTSSPGAFQGNQTATTFDPGTMAEDTTHYWRIDEINASGTTTGAVWSFTTGQQPAIDPNLVGWWEFDNNANDSVGTNDGTIYGAVATSGKIGQAFSFDEVDDYITIPDLDYTNASHEFTLSFWFKIDDVAGDFYHYIFSHGTVSTNNSLNVYFSETNEGTGGEELRTRIGLDNDYLWYSVSEPVFTDGQWHLYTVTVSSVDGATIYVDANSILTDPNVKGASMNPTGQIYVGARNDLNADRFYGNPSIDDGLVDDLRLYNRVLSSTEVATLAAGGAPQPPGQASNPSPADSATDVSIDADLSWTAGSGATSHDVYFGTSSPGTFQGNQTATTFDTGSMSNDTTYYWRIDEVNTEGTTTGNVWSFTTIVAAPGQASNPSPADSATDVSIDADLSWTAGSGATSSDVYFGTSSPGTFQGNQTATTFEPGTMGYDTTYYWRIDQINVGGTTTGAVWSFTTEAAPPPLPGQANNPDPADSAADVAVSAVLSWTAGSDATSRDVYFGTTSPGTFQANQTATTFDPGTMDNDTTYYWRIDEINSTGTTTGVVWNFTTVTAGGQVTVEFGDAIDTNHPGTIEDTYANVGYDGDDNWSTDVTLNTYTWPADTVANTTIIKWDLSSIPTDATVIEATLYLYQVETGGDTSYDLPVHKIINVNPVISACSWNTYDGTNSWTGGTDGGQSDIAAAEDTQVVNATNNEYKTWTVTNMVQDWVTTPSSNYGMLINSDPVATIDSHRFFASTDVNDSSIRPKLIVTYSSGQTPPGQASSPSPADSATDVSIDADLSWTAGSGSTSSDVYFGTTSPGAFQGNQTATTFDLGTLSNDTTYYWRIDEINEAGTTTGNVWSFTTEAAPVTIKINFQPAAAQVPTGYEVDSGEVYADRGNGLTYGWDQKNTQTRDRNSDPDQRYDTLNHLQKKDDLTWEIELSSGTYDVWLVCGDPSYTDQVNTMDVEGTVCTDPDGEDNFDEYNIQVNVTDGRLTIKPATGSSNSKICFVEITPQ